MQMTGAQALIKVLEDLGVEYIYGYPGGSVLALFDAMADTQKIKQVLVREEQAAVHAASGLARITGKPGVCVATSGPGATNLVTGLATAYMDSIPVIAITGQVGTDMIGTDAFQEVDITGITLPITKHNYLVKNVKDIPKVIKEAFHIASTGRPGPVLIDIPKDVAAQKFNYVEPGEVSLKGYKPNYKGHAAQIKNLVKLLEDTKKPVICAGGGVISANACEELAELAKRMQIPVATTLMGISSFDETDELSLGMLGLHGKPVANYAVSDCDLLLGIGMRFDDRVTITVKKFAPHAKIAHIDIDPAEIGKNVNVNLPIVGDIKNVLNEVLSKVGTKEHCEWLNKVAAWKREYPLRYNQADGKLKPQTVIEKLCKLTQGKAIITTDVGQHQMWTAQHYDFVKPGTFISSGGLGTMGYGLPAAVGAQMAAPDSLVITVTGDGSFQMNFAEIATAIEQGLPLKILLFNNSYLCLVRQLQYYACDKKYSGVKFSGNPDFVKLVQAYPNTEAYRIEKPEEIDEILAKALNNGKLTLVECKTSEEEMVYPVVLANKGLNEMVQFPGGEDSK